MKNLNHSPTQSPHCAGIVLFVSLIILLSLTVIGLSAMNNSFVELKSASNIRELDLAYQAAQAGVDAVMCIADQKRSGTAANNPFNKKYPIIKKAKNEDLSIKYDWDKIYDAENLAPFKDVNQPKCSIINSKLSIGTIGSIETGNDLAVTIRRYDDIEKRMRKGNSIDTIICQSFIIDSRYSYPTSGANVSVLAEVCRQKKGT